MFETKIAPNTNGTTLTKTTLVDPKQTTKQPNADPSVVTTGPIFAPNPSLPDIFPTDPEGRFPWPRIPPPYPSPPPSPSPQRPNPDLSVPTNIVGMAPWQLMLYGIKFVNRDQMVVGDTTYKILPSTESLTFKPITDGRGELLGVSVTVKDKPDPSGKSNEQFVCISKDSAGKLQSCLQSQREFAEVDKKITLSDGITPETLKDFKLRPGFGFIGWGERSLMSYPENVQGISFSRERDRQGNLLQNGGVVMRYLDEKGTAIAQSVIRKDPKTGSIIIR